jgi:hypothetical protein|tara:strand:- start:15172 stop:15831 length:660 start_codon:yes stop_codon:yes gene_type:complete
MDTATKIFNKFKDGSLPWLELDINFMEYLDAKEFDNVNGHYVEHREDETHNGWESCCLHGLGVDKTRVAKEYGYEDELNAPYTWTSLQQVTPTAKKFWEDFPAEKYSRIRFMKLNPGGKIDWHNDDPGHPLPDDLCEYLIPINVAVLHPPSCYMEVKDHGIVPWEHGKVFLINILKDHQVVNNANVERIHMIAQAHIGNKRKQFNELLDRSIKKYGISI